MTKDVKDEEAGHIVLLVYSLFYMDFVTLPCTNNVQTLILAGKTVVVFFKILDCVVAFLLFLLFIL